MKRSGIIIWLLMMLAAGKVSASTEINGLFDARSAGMGGTGVAYLDSAGAIPTNPALLDQIDKLALTLDAFFIASQPEAPYKVWRVNQATGERYLTYETVRSKATSAVLPFIGAAFRVHDRVVLGAAVYPVIGQGARAEYRPAPDEFPDLVAVNHVSMGLVEAAAPVSIKILDNLSLGLMWRVTYMTQTLDVPTPINNGFTPPAGILLSPDKSMSANAQIESTGLNFAGFQAGVLWRPIPSLRLGFTYRNEVKVDGKGTTTAKIGTATTVLDTRMGYTNPHMFRAGLALTLLENKLLLAADFKYLLYAGPFKELYTTTISSAGVAMTKAQPAYWRNAYTIQLGAEYQLGDIWRLRAGYIAASSATNPDYAIAYMAPPGLSHLVGGGLGIRVLETLNVDIAAAYVVLASYVAKATQYNAGIGTYASHGVEVSLSATYRL